MNIVWYLSEIKNMPLKCFSRDVQGTTRILKDFGNTAPELVCTLRITNLEIYVDVVSFQIFALFSRAHDRQKWVLIYFQTQKREL